MDCLIVNRGNDDDYHVFVEIKSKHHFLSFLLLIWTVQPGCKVAHDRNVSLTPTTTTLQTLNLSCHLLFLCPSVCLVITEWETVLSHSGDDDDVDRFEDEMVGRV